MKEPSEKYLSASKKAWKEDDSNASENQPKIEKVESKVDDNDFDC